MQLQVRHEARFLYATPVKHSVQSLRLTPRRESRQRAIAWSIVAPGRRTQQLDAHGNLTHLLTLDEPQQEISIVVNGVVEVADRNLPLRHEGLLSPLAYLAPTPLTNADEEVRSLVRRCLSTRSDTLDRLACLAASVAEAIRPGVAASTDVQVPAAAALARGVGGGPDQAHVFIACCRSIGVPARYVSGYVLHADAVTLASHAWVDVWLGDSQRWLAIDVTRGGPLQAIHCRLAIGRDSLDAAPVRSVRPGATESQSLSLKVATATEQ